MICATFVPTAIHALVPTYAYQSAFASILATNIETHQSLPKTIYLSALGAYWNEYVTLNSTTTTLVASC